MKRAASQYARHGWPVVPGAYPISGRFLCDRPGCPTRGCHPAFEDWQQKAARRPADVNGWWSRRPHSVLLQTGTAFDVIEVPGNLGKAALRRLGPYRRDPVSIAPNGRWMFFVRRGEQLRAELTDQLRVILHSEGSWVPAPPTRFPEGRVRWLITPTDAGWRLGDPGRIQGALAAGGRCRERPDQVSGYRW